MAFSLQVVQIASALAANLSANSASAMSPTYQLDARSPRISSRCGTVTSVSEFVKDSHMHVWMVLLDIVYEVGTMKPAPPVTIYVYIRRLAK